MTKKRFQLGLPRLPQNHDVFLSIKTDSGNQLETHNYKVIDTSMSRELSNRKRIKALSKRSKYG